MLTELNSEYRPKSLYDVCIIGGGAAGITVANSARKLGLSVFLGEGGGREYDAESQALYQGRVIGDVYYPLDSARLRYFGGTTNHWGGMCRHLEDHDFLPKAAAPNGGWPIRKADLDPFLSEAREIVEIPAIPPDSSLGANLRRVHFLYSPPVRFGEKFGPIFASDPGIDVCLGANATAVGFDGRSIGHVQFKTLRGREISVVARCFVLACGGIENSRNLLHWNRNLNGALGGDLVGRYWLEHPTETVGSVLSCGIPFSDTADHLSDGPRYQFHVAPTPDFLERNGILNCRLRVDPASLNSWSEAWFCSWIGRNTDPWKSSLAPVRASSEQVPDPSNRVTLDSDVDALGIPRPVLHWRRSRLDKRTVRVAVLEFAKYLAGEDLGRMRVVDWLLDPSNAFACEGSGHCPGAYHHMGGTRMSETRSTGVVDGNCRVFGAENLYVAGSSVFPSTGYSNPTLSIVQLSLRLAHHLKAVIS